VGEHYYLVEGWKEELMTMFQLTQWWHTQVFYSSKEELYLVQHLFFDKYILLYIYRFWNLSMLESHILTPFQNLLEQLHQCLICDPTNQNWMKNNLCKGVKMWSLKIIVPRKAMLKEQVQRLLTSKETIIVY